MMEASGNENHDDRVEDADALSNAEAFILDVAHRYHPSSLSELRELLERESDGEIEHGLLRAALWSLLNQNRLELTPDRTLHVAG
jgi:hypothetical protein